MAFWEAAADLLARLFKGRGHGVGELARRLGVPEDDLRAVRPAYHPFRIPKRSGGTRLILAPDGPFKALQRRILRRLLRRLHCHPAATAFERGRSIATNARPHAGKAVVVCLDLKDFFGSIRSRRVYRCFRAVGWNRDASRLLTRLCTFRGCLPQGAPTSPRLSNLVNRRLDARLAGLAGKAAARTYRNPRTGAAVPADPSVAGLAVAYTRYADDLTFSFTADNPRAIRDLINRAKRILRAEGYEPHGRKQRVYRRHARQVVTGLVVNERVNLPRATRRRLRAVQHHLAQGRPATLRASGQNSVAAGFSLRKSFAS